MDHVFLKLKCLDVFAEPCNGNRKSPSEPWPRQLGDIEEQLNKGGGMVPFKRLINVSLERWEREGGVASEFYLHEVPKRRNHPRNGAVEIITNETKVMQLREVRY